MKVVIQRRANDCAIACFAMLMNISYVKATWLVLSWKWLWYWIFDKTTKVKYLVAASKLLNRELGMYKSNMKFEEFDYEHDAIMILSYNNFKASHAVIWNAANKAIIDPNIHYSYVDLDRIKGSDIYLLIEKDKVNGRKNI